MSDLVRFYSGSENNYLTGYTNGEFKGGIFFSTDTYTIWKDGVLYGTSNSVDLDWINNKFGIAFVEILDGTVDGNYIFSFVDINGDSKYSIEIPKASSVQSGVMSISDKNKIDSIDADNIVYKEEGKGLSSNDFTDEEKELLSTVEPNACPNVLEVVKIDGVILENTNKSVNIDFTDRLNSIVGDKLVSAYVYKGSVDSVDALPNNASVGDVYNITVSSEEYGPEGVNVAWTGSEYDSLGGIFNTANITNEIEAVKADLSILTSRVEDLEGNETRFQNLEKSIQILNSDDSVEGSVAYTATDIANTIVDSKLTWQYI